MRDLLMVIPSRGRPGNIARLRDAMAATCQGDTSLVVGLDVDDPTVPEYPPGIHYVQRPDLHKVTAWVNALAVPAARNFRYIGHFGDDNVPLTPGWDTALMAAMEKTPFAFGNDLYPREPGSLCCHVFMRSSVVQALGYFGPPEIAHMYVDVAWMAWGRACGITYLHDVILEHRHYTRGAPNDATYMASWTGTAADLQGWHSYCRSGRLNSDISKLGGQQYTSLTLGQFNRGLNVPEHW